ncbi:MAG: two-component sensor histidine kinase [Proteobacteria bacterium]|nr:two-component sensor histidine kinase [Pseudomonadota bacterium]
MDPDSETNRSLAQGHEFDGQNSESPAESIRPFQLVKYFSLTGFLVILVFTLGLTIFISQQAKGILLKKSDDYALLLADNLNHQVFLQFVLPTAVAFGRIRLRDPVQYERLELVIHNTIHSFNVRQVKLYDLEGNTIYSTEKSLVGGQGMNSPHYVKALEGKYSSELVSAPGKGLAGFDNKRVLKAFYPFRAERPIEGAVGQVLGVFEIALDLTGDYAEVSKFQYLSIAISLVFIGVLFMVLRPILSRAEKIIEQRNEERRRLEEKLHHSERLAILGQMIAAVSHEIRNPLGIVSSTAEILQNRIKKYEPDNRLAEVIVEESQRLNGIVTEFLDFARPQIPRPQPCQLSDILDKNIRFLAPTLEREGIVVERDYQSTMTIEADPDLLYRAFLNIFLNAVQAMPEGGCISVKTSLPYGPDGTSLGVIEAAIEDTGSGLEPGQMEKLFMPFYTTKNRGSGLGLSIVKNIIDGHKGGVAIRPGTSGGARVEIRLPIARD